MKETAIKATITAALAAVAAYLNALLIPIVVLVVVMLADYGTGMASAWHTKTLSSSAGFFGIAKKLGYLIAVGVGAGVDWIVNSALAQAGISFSGHLYIFGILVAVWLIINELLSILENLSEIGVPLPEFLINIVKKLQKTVEEAAENKEDKPNG